MTRRREHRSNGLLDRILTRADWMNGAPCKGQTDVMYPDKGGDMAAKVRQAAAICHGCPHKLPCLEYAIDNNEDHGVWGGYSVRERRQIARNRRDMGWTTGRNRQVKIEGVV